MAFGNIQGFLNEAFQIAGGNIWDLRTASYNGVNFHVIYNTPFIDNNNPFRGITVNGVLGNDGSALSGSAPLPFGTNSVLTTMQDQIDRRLVIHDIPNRAGNFIEDLGFTGETFTGWGVLFGPNYYDRLSDFLSAFTGDATNQVPLGSKNVFVHPVRGTIQGKTYLKTWTLKHTSKVWRGVVFTFEFVSDNKPSPLVETPNVVNQIYNALAEIESLVTIIAELLQLVSILYSRLSPLNSKRIASSPSGDPQTLNPIVRSEVNQLNAVNQQLSLVYEYACKILYTYLKPPGFTDFYLDRVQPNLSLLPSLFRYITIFTEKEADILVSFYADQVQAAIDLYRSFGLDTVFATKIDTLKRSVVSMDTFAKLLLNLQESNYVSYSVTQDMSLRKILWMNGLNLNTDFQSTMLLNRSVIGSVNKIPAGTVLKLRKV